MKQWVRIRSWHLTKPVPAPGTVLYKTLCGRWVGWELPQTDDRPADAKTCETCLRIQVGR